MSRPRYLQIAEQLEQRIVSGALPAGAMLPTEHELQQQFNVSRVTVRKAMAVLVAAERLYRVRGSGTYVKAPQAEHNAFQLTGFVEEVSAQGKVPSTQLLHFSLEKADEKLCQRLQLPAHAQVYAVSRLRLIDDEPEILEHTFMPVALFPDLSVAAMTHSKYQYIEQQKGYRIAQSRQDVVPEAADKEVASALNIPLHHPVLKVTSLSELSDGRPFEYTVHYFRVNQYRFGFTARRGLE